jgi:predicted metalloprotease with PDZ domain
MGVGRASGWWTSGRRGGGSGDENTINTTISYYSKGGALGPVLDLKIPNETKNQKSLDTVMQTLYKEFYQEKKRGFTDQEFREVCERTAGTSLAEFFDDYINSTKDVDFAKYLRTQGSKWIRSCGPARELIWELRWPGAET